MDRTRGPLTPTPPLGSAPRRTLGTVKYPCPGRAHRDEQFAGRGAAVTAAPTSIREAGVTEPEGEGEAMATVGAKAVEAGEGEAIATDGGPGEAGDSPID